MFTLGSFYRSEEWEKLRNVIIAERMARDGELICEYCGKPIVNRYDCIAHHKTILTSSNVNDYDVSLNADNIQLVHHHCHNAIHQRFGFMPEKKAFIVWGSPCAGKSTFVDKAMDKDDLIVDIDRLYEAVSNTGSNALHNTVMMLYRFLIDTVKTRQGKWHNAWIVRCFPFAGERERLAKDIDAELIFIDTDKETCLARAAERAEGYDKIVTDWWENFTPSRQVPDH